MKINSILIGKGSGSAGNVTVTQLKGQTILKQKATIVANPNTVPQQNQRRMMNRAVYAWQMIGNTIKAGWTSVNQTWSQFNAFVSANAAHFKNAAFTPATFKFLDLIGAQATKGKLGSTPLVDVEISAGEATVLLEKSAINAIAKVGDKLVLTGGPQNSSEGDYHEFVINQAFLDSAQPSFSAEISDGVGIGQYVAAVYLVTADGKDSTTSNFVLY